MKTYFLYNIIVRNEKVSSNGIALLSLNRSCFFILLDTVAKIGAIMVPLNWRLSNGELSYVLGDSSPKILFFDRNHEQIANDLTINSSVDLLDVMEIQAGVGETPLSDRSVRSVRSKVSMVDQDTPLCIDLYCGGGRSSEGSCFKPWQSSGC